jgi:hypothetical protein
MTCMPIYQRLPGTEAFALPGLISFFFFPAFKIQALGSSGNPTTILKI